MVDLSIISYVNVYQRVNTSQKPCFFVGDLHDTEIWDMRMLSMNRWFDKKIGIPTNHGPDDGEDSVLVVVVICVKIGDCPNADLHFAARKAPILPPTPTIQAYTLWQSPSIWVRCGENVGSNMFSAVHNHLTDVTLTPCLLHVFRKLSVVGPVSPTDLLYLCHRPNPSRLATVIWDDFFPHENESTKARKHESCKAQREHQQTDKFTY